MNASELSEIIRGGETRKVKFKETLPAQPDIEFINDAAGEQFIVKIPRVKDDRLIDNKFMKV